MKIFVLSLSCLIIISIFATLNAVMLCKKTTEIITALEALPTMPDKQSTDNVFNLWNEHKNFFNLTTSHTTTDKIQEAFCQLKSAETTRQTQYARDVLLILIIDMKETASISLDRIL